MVPQFICHPDFENLTPVNVFHKQLAREKMEPSPSEYQNRHILFRRKLFLTNTENAILKITADDYYKLYINGEFVTQGPASNYPQGYYYNEIDISSFLKKGENTFAVHTYYQGLINRVWVSGDLRQMMYFHLSVNGESVLVSDESWLCANHTGYTALDTIGYDTAFTECYDSSAPETDFYKEDFDDTGWSKAAIFKKADYNLQKQPTKQLEIYDIKPQTVKRTSTKIFADFGFEAVGYISLKAKGNKGDCVIIRVGEELNPDGTVRYDMRCNCRYEDKWLLSGKDDTLIQFDYKTFRYMELVFPVGVEFRDIAFTIRHYPFKENISYNTKSEKLTKILSLCQNTIKYSTQEAFLDCPSREKGQYLGDASVTARAYTVLTGDTTPMKKAINEFLMSSFICPGIMAVSGASLMQEIADYSLQLPAQICWVYSIDKDIDFLKAAEPYITKLYKYFLQFMNEDYLLDSVTEKWNLVDWPHNLRDGYDFPLTIPIGAGIHNVINAFWCGFLQAMDEFYSILGMEKTGLTKKAHHSFVKHFFNNESGLFTDSPHTLHSSIHSNILPLLFDIGITEDIKENIVKLLKEKRLTSMGVYMSYFALCALMTHGESQLAEELVTDEACWLNMLKEGATTTFEAWGKDQKKNTSLCHPWATAPAIIFADNIRVY